MWIKGAGDSTAARPAARCDAPAQRGTERQPAILRPWCAALERRRRMPMRQPSHAPTRQHLLHAAASPWHENSYTSQTARANVFAVTSLRQAQTADRGAFCRRRSLCEARSRQSARVSARAAQVQHHARYHRQYIDGAFYSALRCVQGASHYREQVDVPNRRRLSRQRILCFHRA